VAKHVVIAGGGPAGMMLGLLLARAGVRATVLEKHPDFLRDFRGDTIHPSTLQVLHELGLLEAFLKLPHQEVRFLEAQFGEERVRFVDFARVRTRCPFIAMIPQWDFLDFLAREARRFGTFALAMQAQATELIFDGARVRGVIAQTPQGAREFAADLVVGADGRHSTIRERAELPLVDLGAPIDALWFRVSRSAADPADTMARFDRGSILVMLNRGDYWQCAFVIAKGAIEDLKRRGLAEFRSHLGGLMPFAAPRMEEIRAWEDVKLLTVQVNRLTRWYRDGLLCIGDAAHAMSPVGGVGINLAIQDAVAAANVLYRGDFGREQLAAVQRRREFPTRVTQGLQVIVQNRVLARFLVKEGDPIKAPLALRLAGRFALLRQIPARLIGIGVRPEHVRSPAVTA
jgi:2-polyprenyl-6-methoxyphenol hydroxylase-like FAD-dependent oxidoreductase